MTDIVVPRGTFELRTPAGRRGRPAAPVHIDHAYNSIGRSSQNHPPTAIHSRGQSARTASL
eukprot:15453878-Alexandrium_andersonii.AAC.1